MSIAPDTTRLLSTVAFSTSVAVGTIQVVIIALFFRRLKQPSFRAHYKYPKLSFAVAIAYAVLLLAERPLQLLSEGMLLHQLPSNPILIRISRAVTSLFAVPCYLLSFLYMWVVFYDIRWSMAVEDADWRAKLDPSDSSFFLQYKRTLGNPRWFAVVVLVYGGMTSVAMILVSGNTLMYMRLWTGFSIITTLGIVLVVLATPRFEDLVGARRQMMGLAFTFLVGQILYVCLLALTATKRISRADGVVLFTTPILLAAIAYTYFMLFYPVRSISLASHPVHALNAISQSMSNTQSSSASSGKRLAAINARVIKTSLSDIHIFGNFMKHMTLELCVENMLFLAEITMLKNLLFPLTMPKVFMDVDRDDDRHPSLSPRSSAKSGAMGEILRDSTLGLTLSRTQNSLRKFRSKTSITEEEKIQRPMDNDTDLILPPEIPMSSILADTSTTMLEKGNKLFEKYIEIGSVFEVNISYPVRKRLMEKFARNTGGLQGLLRQATVGGSSSGGEMTEKELFQVFDEAYEEVFSLLLQAFRRYELTLEHA